MTDPRIIAGIAKGGSYVIEKGKAVRKQFTARPRAAMRPAPKPAPHAPVQQKTQAEAKPAKARVLKETGNG